MRIFLYELKKLFDWRIIAVIAALGALIWFAVLSEALKSYNSLATHGIYGKYQTEMFRLYGEELSPDELLDYDIPGKIAEAYNEADAIIAANPIFAQYGNSDFKTYLEFEESLSYRIDGNSAAITLPDGSSVPEADRAQMNALLNGGSGETSIDDWYKSPANRANSLKALSLRYSEYQSRLDHYIHNDSRPLVARTAEKLANNNNASLIRYDLCSIFSQYAAIVGVFSALSAMLFTAPLLINDRASKVNLLQYSSAIGRKIVLSQTAAIIFSAFALSSIIIALGYAPFISQAKEYWNARITALDQMIWLYNITFGQYAMIHAGMSLAFSVSAVCFAFLLAMHSSNVTTLMIKAVPVGAAVALMLGVAATLAFSSENMIFSQVFQGRFPAPEVIVCIFIAAFGMLTASIAVVREKKADIL